MQVSHVTVIVAVIVALATGADMAQSQGLPGKLPASKPKESTTQPAKGTWAGSKDKNTGQVWIPDWEACYKEHLDRAKKGGIDLLFVGDSLTWGWVHAKDVFEKHFGRYNAEYFGIVSDKTQNLLYRMQNGELDGIKPKVVVMLIGANSLGAGAKGVADGIEANIKTIQAKVPGVKILLMGVFPMKDKDDPARAIVKESNALAAKFADGKSVRFMDIGEKLTDAEGNLGEGLFGGDKLHVTPKGYEVWASAIDATVKEMMGGAATTAPASAPAAARPKNAR